MAKPYVEAEVKGKRVLRVDAPFDEALIELRKSGIKNPMSSEELAYARTYHLDGKQSSLMTRGSYTMAGYAYLKDEKPIRVPFSPLSDASMAKKATEANRKGNYFSDEARVYEKLAKIAERDKNREPEKRRAIFLPSRDSFAISTKKNLDVFANIFGNAGKKYLDFLGFDSLTFYPVDKGIVDAQSDTILTQEWLARLDNDSSVRGGSRSLDYDGTVRGVQLVTAEGSSQKTDRLVLPYTAKDLRNAEREFTKLSKMLKPEEIAGIQGLLGKLRGN